MERRRTGETRGLHGTQPSASRPVGIRPGASDARKGHTSSTAGARVGTSPANESSGISLPAPRGASSARRDRTSPDARRCRWEARSSGRYRIGSVWVVEARRCRGLTRIAGVQRRGRRSGDPDDAASMRHADRWKMYSPVRRSVVGRAPNWPADKPVLRCPPAAAPAFLTDAGRRADPVPATRV